MSTLIGSLWWFVISLGLLVTFHEFGYYWVARRNGVKVLRFSVGFGRALWSRRGRDGTEYVIAAIPLGGYVKMLDERERSEEHTSELQSLMRISYAVFCLKKKTIKKEKRHLRQKYTETHHTTIN